MYEVDQAWSEFVVAGVWYPLRTAYAMSPFEVYHDFQ